MRVLVTSLLLFTLLFLVTTNTTKKTLVLLDSFDIKNSHSQFFNSLKERGHDLEFRLASDSSNKLSQFGDYLYDNLIIMAPSTEEFGGEIRSSTIQEFIDSEPHHAVIIVSSNVLSEPLRDTAKESGIEFDDDNTNVIDHFNYDTVADKDGKHTTIVADQFIDKNVIVGEKRTPVLFKGLGMSLDEDNKLLIPILTGSSTSYSYTTEPITDNPHVMGKDTVLVAGLQARNGARMTFIGSLDMLSNEFFDSNINRFKLNGKPEQIKSGNKEFAIALSKWALRERGVLRHRDVYHHKLNETEMQTAYRITDDIEYTVVIEEFRDGKWVPYIADDIQLELIMLDPYIRKTLQHVKDGKYVAQFRVPDVYGVFKFKVDYRRVGYTQLIYSDQIIIRPLRLNEYERFIESAYPYYASAFSIMIGFFLFGLVFLYTRDDTQKLHAE